MTSASSIQWQFPYPSQRMPVLAGNVVAASQPLAAQAGLLMLHKGGNAVDAALATAMTLTVVEPTGNGIGSDAFALVWDGRELHGLNGSGRAPRPGKLFRNPAQAATLEELAQTRGESMYRGALAERIASQSGAEGGALSLEDLANHSSTWVEPISQAYRGLELHEIPPNGQGIAALMALGILEHFDLAQYPRDSAQSLHLQVEAMKLGFIQAHNHVADPESMNISAAGLLSPERLARMADTISLDRAASSKERLASSGGTVYLTAADASGMMVSFIQSNFWDFGSGVVVRDTGISLQSRGLGFSLDASHPNCVQGGRRPFHTIIPGFVTMAGAPVMSFGVMGAHMQPQGHVQIMVRMFDYGLNPQAACDAPRWCLTPDFDLALEPGFSAETIQGLQARGHRVLLEEPMSVFGGAQLIHRLEHGFCAASDPRKDGQAAGF